MTDLAALIERLERATGPDRNLDAMIFHFIMKGEGVGARGSGPPYTSSIDAAMTLVPDGDPWTLGQSIHFRYWHALVSEFGADQQIHSRGYGTSDYPAIALSIAALKSRAVQTGGA